MLPGSRDATKNVSMLRPAIAAFLIVAAPFAGALVAAPQVHAADPSERPHELGWLCMNVSDVGVTQVSAFNKDAPSFSIWVPKARLYIEPTGPGSAGRVCVPTVVRLGDGALPAETLVFERTVVSGNVHRPADRRARHHARGPLLAEVTIEVIGLAEQWTLRDGTLTYQSVRPVEFPGRLARGLLGDGEGPPPPEIFRAVVAPALRGALPTGRHGRGDDGELRQLRAAHQQGQRPRPRARPPRGRHQGLALRRPGPRHDLLAVARPADRTPPTRLPAWLLVARATKMRAMGRRSRAWRTGRYHTVRGRSAAIMSAVSRPGRRRRSSDIPMAGIYGSSFAASGARTCPATLARPVRSQAARP